MIATAQGVDTLHFSIASPEMHKPCKTVLPYDLAFPAMHDQERGAGFLIPSRTYRKEDDDYHQPSGMELLGLVNMRPLVLEPAQLIQGGELAACLQVSFITKKHQFSPAATQAPLTINTHSALEFPKGRLYVEQNDRLGCLQFLPGDLADDCWGFSRWALLRFWSLDTRVSSAQIVVAPPNHE
ncbi:hypothetical protein VNO77_44174 [Canavalia gladiata]|uniref:Uncharacterized protein n=1 Tax=Canavalia gladiata TaxID=3824 RepID=A0AAN9JWK2_CANGL